MEKILVPTDFSPNADKALNFAVQIAKKAKAKIFLIHACDLLELAPRDSLGLKKEYNKKVINEATEELQQRSESIRKGEMVAIQTKLYKGFVTDTILNAVQLHSPDLIVMGTLGSAGAKERILGSKTAGVIGKTNVPVLVIPLLSEWADPSNIMLALNNFTEGKPEIIRPAIELAELFKANLTVVKFSEDPVPAYKSINIERAGNTYIKKIQTLAENIKSTFVHLDGHKFEKRIEKYISQENIDLLVMITHKRRLLKSLFNRSMTKRMSYHSRVPLLAILAKS